MTDPTTEGHPSFAMLGAFSNIAETRRAARFCGRASSADQPPEAARRLSAIGILLEHGFLTQSFPAKDMKTFIRQPFDLLLS